MNLIDHHYESDCHHHKSNCHHHDQELRTEADLEMIGNKKAKEVKTIRNRISCCQGLKIKNVLLPEEGPEIENILHPGDFQRRRPAG